MLRHVIAPAHSYAQIPNTILRHPRLSPDAKALLTWQLSLPSDEGQCLSDTARRAGIGKCAFQRAKRQLLGEGYLHEWRTRIDGGRFRTVQLVSNEPLSAQEALTARDGRRPAPPSDRKPTAGEPTCPTVGRQPKKNTRENTTPPTAPTPDAEAFLRSLGLAAPRLAMSARTARKWAPLAQPWLDGGLDRDQIRHTLTHGLDGTRSPLGALRWRLEHALPDVPPAPVAAPRPEPRVARMRECTGAHTQPRLFTPPPGVDEARCPDCRTEPEAAPREAPEATGSGFDAFIAARPPRRPDNRATRARERDRTAYAR